jgi:phospho-N-acetylmuramoyl-pentapeptide-transferase
MDGNLATWAVIAALLISLGLVLAFGKPMIRLLRRVGAGQRVRDDGPQRHLEKEGTPTMGGILIVAAAVLTAVGAVWAIRGPLSQAEAPWGRASMLAVAAVAVGCALVGISDDWRKIRKGRSLGLRAREKLLLQFILSAAFVSVLVWSRASTSSRFYGPFYTSPYLISWAVFWALAVVATSNAMNLADGLDGLAAGLCLISSLGLATLALRESYLSLAIFAASLAGACLGFLWFNRHPAKVFMGDVGSLALGGAMAAMAARLNAPLALLGLCLIPFIEMLSVIIQVISFKTTGKRVFKMSPIHHHFELSGWSERKVVYVFWLVQAVAAAAVVTWRLVR